MDLAIGICETPNGRQLVAVEGGRAWILAALEARYRVAHDRPESATAASTRIAADLTGFLTGGPSALDRVVELIGWAQEADADLGSSEGAASYELAGLASFPPDGEIVDRFPRARLKAPISTMSTIFCLGDVFLSHLQATDSPVPDSVGIFYKLTQDVVGPWESIVLPRPHAGGRMVGGTELALVVGKAGRYVPPDRAWDHIWGYSVLNDVTLRGLPEQLGPTNKVFETSAPVGPFLVPKEQVGDPRNLGLKLRINGRQVQNGNTRDMRFDMAESVAELSNWHTLKPGDIIATGDIGSIDRLAPGDVVEAEVERVGVLVNRVILG